MKKKMYLAHNRVGRGNLLLKNSVDTKKILSVNIRKLIYISEMYLFNMLSCSPSQMLNISKNLLCTHRSPMDVAHALQEIYCGIYSAKRAVYSLHIVNIKATPVLKDIKNTFYLTFTQEEKDSTRRFNKDMR